MTELHSRSTEWATPAQERAYDDLSVVKQMHGTIRNFLNQASLEFADAERKIDNGTVETELHAVYDAIQEVYDAVGNALHVAEQEHRLAE